MDGEAPLVESGGEAGGELPGYRKPPQNVEAEQALLGAILIDNAGFDRVSTFLEPDHFHVPVHGRIFEAARSLIARGRVADPLTLKSYFEAENALADVGGAHYLARLAASAVSLVHTEDYGRAIRDLSTRRGLVRIGEETTEAAYDARVEAPPAALVEQAEARLYELAETGRGEGGFRALSDVMTEAVAIAESAYKRDGRLAGIATGLTDLDDAVGGLAPSDLVILAGRPSMGKTALAASIALRAASRHRTEPGEDGEDSAMAAPRGGAAASAVDGAVVGFFSLEMSGEQLATRILAARAGLRADEIRRGQLSDEQFARLVDAARALAAAPLFIDDTPALTVPALRARARRLKRKHGLSLVVVDYLQLMRPSRGHDSRVLEIGEITQGLKAIAKDLDLPVLALSQLSRAVEQREDKRPMLSDLRESGTIEQDSDIVMFIFRESYYLERSEPQPRGDEAADRFDARHARWVERCEEQHGRAEVIVAKHRHGPIKTVALRFEAETVSFDDLADADRLPERIP